MRTLKPIPVRDLLHDGEPESGLVDGLIPRGAVTLLSAPPKEGKSYFANHLAACVQSGESFLGQSVVKATPVLYLDRESSYSELWDRFGILRAEYPAAEEVEFLREGIDIARDIEPLLSLVRAGGYGLVVIDTLATVIVGRDENDAGSMSEPLDAIRRLAVEGETAVLVVAHAPKSGLHGAVAAKTRGSNAITAAAHQLLSLSSTRKAGESRLDIVPRTSAQWSMLVRRRDDGFWNPSLKVVA